jgi:hypothetical protein
VEVKEEIPMSPIGHFSVGLAAKRAAPQVPLGILLFATLVIDFLWFFFFSIGIENNSERIEFSYIPWSHGLVMAIVWSILAGIIAFFISKDRRTSIVIGLVVFSHWVLDFIGHDPDLPLFFDNTYLVGLGLEWTHTPTGLVVHYAQGLILEFGLFIVGFIIYWRARKQLALRTRGHLKESA